MSALLSHRSVFPRRSLLRTTSAFREMKRAITIEFDDSIMHRCPLIRIRVHVVFFLLFLLLLFFVGFLSLFVVAVEVLLLFVCFVFFVF